jgi:hypothetical protein
MVNVSNDADINDPLHWELWHIYDITKLV